MDNSVIKQDFGMVGDLTTAFRDYAIKSRKDGSLQL